MKLTKVFQKLKCWFHACPHMTMSDEMDVWGEYTICGQRVGVISREKLRRYLDGKEGCAALQPSTKTTEQGGK